MLFWPQAKDPDDIKDYQVDWSDWLDGDTIATSVFSPVTAAGVAIASQTHADSTATVWLSGGTNGGTARLLNRITTTAGRRQDETIVLKIRAR